MDSQGRFAYFADVGSWTQKPAIVVLDSKNRKSWRLLEKASSVMAQDWVIRNPIKTMEFFGGLVGFKTGIDGIALTHDDKWLYYGAMNHKYFFKIKTDVLNTENISNVASSVIKVAEKPMSDGFSIDKDGRVYITDIENGAVHVWEEKIGLSTLVKSDKIKWADSLSFGPNRELYLADSQIPNLILQSKRHMKLSAPYFVYKLNAPGEGRAGQ